jgi:hypothetical protein
MWVNPPEGSLNLVVLTARSLVPFHRKWQSGRLRDVGAPWTLRPALTGGLPLNTSVWLPRGIGTFAATFTTRAPEYAHMGS